MFPITAWIDISMLAMEIRLHLFGKEMIPTQIHHYLTQNYCQKYQNLQIS